MGLVNRRGDATFVVGMVSAAHFVSHVYLLAYPPLFPLLGPAFDVTAGQLGLLVTAIYVPTLLLQLPLGGVVDRVGAKRVLVAGLVVTSVGITLSGLATTYWLLLACAFLSGIGQSVFHPADYALLDTVTETHNEGTAFSAHTFGGFAGFAAAPVFVGGIAVVYGWQLALVVVGSIGFLFAALLSLTMASVHTRRVRRVSERGGDDGAEDDGQSLLEGLSFVFRKELLLVFVFYLVSMMAIVGLQSFTTVFGVESLGLDESGANALLTAYLVFSAIGVVTGGPLADRVSYRLVVVATFAASGVLVWIVALGGSGAGVYVAVALVSLVGLLMGAALPSRDKFANAAADPGATGKSFGFFFTGLSLGAVVSPALLGAIIDAWSVSVAFLLVGAFLVLATPVVVVARPTSRGTAASGR